MLRFCLPPLRRSLVIILGSSLLTANSQEVKDLEVKSPYTNTSLPNISLERLGSEWEPTREYPKVSPPQNSDIWTSLPKKIETKPRYQNLDEHQAETLDKNTLLEIISNPDQVTPNKLRLLGKELLDYGSHAEGMFWYQLGRLRILQDKNYNTSPQNKQQGLLHSFDTSTLPKFLEDTKLGGYSPKLKTITIAATRRAIQWDRIQPKKYDRQWTQYQGSQPETLRLERLKSPDEDAQGDEALRNELLYEAIGIVEAHNINLLQPEERKQTIDKSKLN